MRKQRRLAVFAPIALSCLCVAGCSVRSSDVTAASTLEELRAALEQIAQRADGIIGIGIEHIESGEQVMVNGDVRFPLGSAYKFPIAVALLNRVVEGELSLNQKLPFEEHDRHPGSGYIAKVFEHPGVDISLVNYLDLMMVQSDNSAADIVIEAAGGPNAVSEYMVNLGLPEVRVDRRTIDLLADINGLAAISETAIEESDAFFAAYERTTAASRQQALEAFEQDPRDTATPAAMTELLRLVWTNEILNPDLCQLLVGMMERCATGERRIRGGVPEGVVVAHKSGTVGRSANDIGVVTLPEGKGHVIVVVLIKESDAEAEEREAVIAEIAADTYACFAGR